MIYALRKLIAFVFLGGIFWFVYSDPADIGKPWFMHALGVITIIFGIFWIVVPVVVVKCRVRKRIRHNRIRYSEWLAKNGDRPIEPQKRENPKLKLEDGERVYYHEKGTLYVEKGSGFDEVAVPGKPGDVAFPGKRRLSRKLQRTHFYLTDQRLLFVGKSLDFGVRLEELDDFKTEPGGISCRIRRGGRQVYVAMTFQNPLVVAHILNEVRLTFSASP